MSISKKTVAFLTAVLFTGQALCPPAVLADPPSKIPDWLRSVFRRGVENRAPHAPGDAGVERVAREIDWLEHLIETYGTVVPKHPDVWGEARLTKHRQEYEEQMLKMFEKDEFKQTLQGAIRRSDQSLLSGALSLDSVAATAPKGETASNAAVTLLTSPPFGPNGDSTKLLPNPLGTASFGSVGKTSDTPAAPVFSLEPTVVADQFSRYLQSLNELRRINEGDDTADSPGYALNLVRIPVSVLPGKHTREGYGAEVTFTISPYLSDDLLPSTMRQLIINDVVEQHSIPVVTLLNNRPSDADKLIELFTTTESRVRNWMDFLDGWLVRLRAYNSSQKPTDAKSAKIDGYIRLVYSLRSYLQMRFMQLASSEEIEVAPVDFGDFTFTTTNQDIAYWFDLVSSPVHNSPAGGSPQGSAPAAVQVFALNGKVWWNDRRTPSVARKQIPSHGLKVGLLEPAQFARTTIPDFVALPLVGFLNPEDKKQAELSPLQGLLEPLSKLTERLKDLVKASNLPTTILDALSFITESDQSLKQFLDSIDSLTKAGVSGPEAFRFASHLATISSTPYGNPISVRLDDPIYQGGHYGKFTYTTLAATIPARGTVAERALAPSQYLQTMGFDHFMHLATDVKRTLDLQPTNAEFKNVVDVRRAISEEAVKSYRMLDAHQGALWRHASPALAEAIVNRDFEFVTLRRKEFFAEFGEQNARSATGTLAWGIIVEAALLDARLKEDMVRTSQAKGCGCLATAEHLSFIGSRETLLPEAVEAFRQYVACRWPIIVFALDPVSQEQNVADVFSRRRELQLAVSVAVADGKMNPNAAVRFMRQVEMDIETITLNRTQIGFSHGNDTFGWRFYPRMQGAEVPGTLGAFTQTLLGGGASRDQELRGRRLEAGMRECTAVVLMPSFVPYVTVESRGNWFGLANPEKKVLTLHDTMQISRNYQAVRSFYGEVCRSNLYRPGDVSQLSRVLDQLDRRMPLQQFAVQVPHLNRLGGFDLFETGASSLGPRLDGWYGSPGINPNDSTTLFLIGDHFSIHETRVIAGGRCCDFKMLSRELLEVVIPPGVQRLHGQYSDLVDVQAGSPYGPSSHMLIPIGDPPSDGKLYWDTPTAQSDFSFSVDTDGKPTLPAVPVAVFPQAVSVHAPTAVGAPTLTLQYWIDEVVDGREVMLTFGKFASIPLNTTEKRYSLDGDALKALQAAFTQAATARFELQPPVDGETMRWHLRAVVSPTAAAGAAVPVESVFGSMTFDLKLKKK